MPGACRVAPASEPRVASADLFGQGDDDARGAAEMAEPEDALELRHLAKETSTIRQGAGGSAPSSHQLDDGQSD